MVPGPVVGMKNPPYIGFGLRGDAGKLTGCKNGCQMQDPLAVSKMMLVIGGAASMLLPQYVTRRTFIDPCCPG